MKVKPFKTFKRWVERKNKKTSFSIIQSYYIRKELGQPVRLFSIRFLMLFIKRLFFVLLSLSRFRHIDFQSYFRSKTPGQFFKRLFGFHKHQYKHLLPAQPDFQPLHFPVAPQPVVSIIIAVHNHLKYTYNCLASLLQHTPEVSYEIILINDQSTDDTAAFMAKVSNIVYIENKENIGFLRSCNKAAKSAKGQYLCFLNNDTEVTPLWLSSMLLVFQLDRQTGLVGAKLIYPYGLLQEAGGLINHLGEPINYGRYQDPSSHLYNSIRECDYCSGACILVKEEDFSALNGFDQQFAPAYYEDTDLAFSIRYRLNKKVYYQPLAEVIHFEGVSSGKVVTAGSAKEYQHINADKFNEKWKNVLTSFPEANAVTVLAHKFRRSRSILFIDEFIPEPDTNSGSRRLFELIKIFKSMDFHVLFLANEGKKKEPYFSNLVNLGVQVLYPAFEWQKAIPELQSVLNTINIAWISRPHLNRLYAPYIKGNPNITWVYDTVDLHFIREERGLSLLQQVPTQSLQQIEETKKEEIQLAKQADLTIAITKDEETILLKEGARKVATITNIHTPQAQQVRGLANRHGILFIGGYNHQPNVDAVFWLVEKIMPIVWKQFPEVKVTLLGSSPAARMNTLKSDRVAITGYIEDVSDYFQSARLFVAPLRYGAGMKGKVGQSLEFGLPVITTSIGAEGMNLRHGHDVLIGDTEEELAQEIIRLYQDDQLWTLMSSHAQAAIQRYSPDDIRKQLEVLFNDQ